MYYRTCPDCGANLDPGETCDCKRKGSPHANEIDPEDETAKPQPHNAMISHSPLEIKSNILTLIRTEKNVAPSVIVETVKALFPKFDRTLLSKCEHGDEYGIEMCRLAIDELLAKYAPEYLAQIKYERGGRHKMAHSISCRLSDTDYERIVRRMDEDGYNKVQAWLTHVLRVYLSLRQEGGE